MPRLNNTEKYILQFAEFLKRISDKIKLFIAKKHFPKYHRNALSVSEYMGNKKMYRMTKPTDAKNYE